MINSVLKQIYKQFLGIYIILHICIKLNNNIFSVLSIVSITLLRFYILSIYLLGYQANVLHKIGERIGMKLAEAEEAGAKGDVNTSLALMADVEELKKEKSSIESDYRSTMPASSYQQQKLRVCEICCAYLGIHDNDRRLADHFGGKLHLGFVEIREKLLQINGRVLEKRGLLTQEERDRELQRDEDRLVRRKLYSDG